MTLSIANTFFSTAASLGLKTALTAAYCDFLRVKAAMVAIMPQPSRGILTPKIINQELVSVRTLGLILEAMVMCSLLLLFW